MVKRRWAIVPALILVVLARAASAAYQYDVDVPLEKYDITPIYDPVSKRYFAYMPSNPENIPWRSEWEWADKLAKHLVFHGVHGRLAIIDSLEVHEFLLSHFHSAFKYTNGPAWIGLHYLCDQKQLQWSDGRFWKPGDFQAWDTEWNHDQYTCHSGSNDWFAPIAYENPTFRWMAKGRGKGYDFSFVEFPTGQP